MNCLTNEPKLNQLKAMVRGDSRAYKFRRRTYAGETITDTPESLYFTLKTSFKTEDYVLQKRLGNMNITQDGYWHFLLTPQDTESLDYGRYCWDIQVVQDGYKTTIARGYLELTNESTWEANEQ